MRFDREIIERYTEIDRYLNENDIITGKLLLNNHTKTIQEVYKYITDMLIKIFSKTYTKVKIDFYSEIEKGIPKEKIHRLRAIRPYDKCYFINVGTLYDVEDLPAVPVDLVNKKLGEEDTFKLLKYTILKARNFVRDNKKLNEYENDINRFLIYFNKSNIEETRKEPLLFINNILAEIQKED